MRIAKHSIFGEDDQHNLVYKQDFLVYLDKSCTQQFVVARRSRGSGEMIPSLRTCGQHNVNLVKTRQYISAQSRKHQHTASIVSRLRPDTLRARDSIIPRPAQSCSKTRSFSSSSTRKTQFQPLTPPSPESLGRPRPAQTYRRTRKLFRRIVQLALLVGSVHLIDEYFFDAVLTRCTRTFSVGLYAALDYKINFRANPPFANSLVEVHERNARRLFHLLRENGGLYLKIGQAIAMQSAILPPEFQKMFASMFDDAPQNSWEDVRRVVREDFGKEIEEVFGVSFEGSHQQQGKGIMERTARASASVAQVHWARLADGQEVAIKIQKREIERQVGWDLWAFKYVAPCKCS